MAGDHAPDLGRNAANHVALSPVSFLRRAADTWPGKVAVRHGDLAFTYAQLESRCRRLASALTRRGIGARRHGRHHRAQRAAMLEAHYAVPGNRGRAQRAQLPARRETIAFCSGTRREGAHRRPRVLARGGEGAGPVREEAAGRRHRRTLGPGGRAAREVAYEALLEEGDPGFVLPGPREEWDSLACSTLGDDGRPQGRCLSPPRRVPQRAGQRARLRADARSVYLWTLPMFTATLDLHLGRHRAGGTHVCLRRVDPALIFPAIARHRVDPPVAAPIVLEPPVHAPDGVKLRFDHPWRSPREARRRPRRSSRHGAHGVPRDAPLRAHGELRPGDALRLQDDWDGLGLEARCASHGAPGRAYPTLEDLQWPIRRPTSRFRATARRWAR